MCNCSDLIVGLAIPKMVASRTNLILGLNVLPLPNELLKKLIIPQFLQQIAPEEPAHVGFFHCDESSSRSGKVKLGHDSFLPLLPAEPSLEAHHMPRDNR